jgi:thiamine-phosphate pyrophosphorylase
MLVTDRHRLVAETGAPPGDWAAVLTAQIAGAVAGEVDLIQVREPDLEADTLSRFLIRLFASVPGSQSRVVVNRMVEVARAVGARGVHLPEGSHALRDIRTLASTDKQWVMGRSVHTLQAVTDSAGASYLLAGTVLSSESKPTGWTTLGWAGLKTLVSSAGHVPVVAIGGLSTGDIPAIVRAGATGLAGIGCFVPRGQVDVSEFVRARVTSMRLAFDTVGTDPYTEEADREP